ncbi:MAG: hypothetical protein ACTH8F_08345 [Microbacterium sp.]|uniref:hypothetical protein n=1 Tax=Microbacterium sp. TaxID=51671 RepID=UPI003F9AFB77
MFRNTATPTQILAAAGSSNTLLTDVLNLFTTFAILGGGVWLVWGVIVLAGGLKDHNGPQIQTGVWQVIGGALIMTAAGLFKVLAVPAL